PFRGCAPQWPREALAPDGDPALAGDAAPPFPLRAGRPGPAPFSVDPPAPGRGSLDAPRHAPATIRQASCPESEYRVPSLGSRFSSVLPFVGEAHGLARVELDDVEVGREIEILRHAETRVTRAEKSAARAAGPPRGGPLTELPAHDRVLANMNWQDLEAHFREGLREERRADRLGLLPASKVQGVLP